MPKWVSGEFKDISEEHHIGDLDVSIKRGNHKSASSKEKLLTELAMDDTISGFQVTIPIEASNKIKNKVITPYALADQYSKNYLGEVIKKIRIADD